MTDTMPAPVAGVVPYLAVDDARRAIAFYVRAFGATELYRQAAPDGRVLHATLSLNGGQIYLSDDFPEMSGGRSRTPKALGDSPVALHLNVPDIDATAAQAVAAGATVEMPVQDMFWGDRYGVLRDPFGHRWSLATRQRQASAAEMKAAVERFFPQPA